MRFSVLLMMAAAMALTAPTLAGCGGGNVQTVNTQNKPPPRKKPADEDKSTDLTAEIEDVYHYSPIGKRDPFRSPILKAQEQQVITDPLQKYDLDQYQLVGVIWGADSEDSLAMVEDPTGTGHVIHHGTIIGKNWGTVTQIKTDEVIVTEELQDIDDRIITNEFSLELARPEAQGAQAAIGGRR